MHSFICYHRSTRPRTVYIFILRLSPQSFSGLVGEAASPTIFLLPHSGTAIICPLGCCLLLGLFQHLGYLIVIDSQLCPIWTYSWGIRSVLEVSLICQCLRRFWKGFWSCRGIFPVVPTWYGLSFLSNFLGGICSYLQFFDRLISRMAALTWDLPCPSFPCDDRGSKIIGGTASLHPGKSDPWLLFSFSRDGEGFGGILPFSPTGPLGYPYFPMFCD